MPHPYTTEDTHSSPSISGLTLTESNIAVSQSPRRGVHGAYDTLVATMWPLDRRMMNELNPFDLEDPALFPEWYYCFKQNFSEAIPSGYDYCTYPLGDFRLRFSGQPHIIDDAVSCVEQRFHECLSFLLENKSFVEPDMFFNRAYVEDELIQKLEKLEKFEKRRTASLLRIRLRRNFLIRRAAQGDFQPLLNHLLAYSARPEYIWDTFLLSTSFWTSRLTSEQLEKFEDSITKAKMCSDNISDQISTWYHDTEDTREQFSVSMNRAMMMNDSEYDVNSNMENKQTKVHANKREQGKKKKGPCKTKVENPNVQKSSSSNRQKHSATESNYENENDSAYPTCTFTLHSRYDIHIINDKSLMRIVSSIPHKIDIDGPRIVEAIGIMKIEYLDGYQLTLHNVHYIPDFPSILSLYRLRIAGDSVAITTKGEAINSHTRQVVSSYSKRRIDIPVTILPVGHGTVSKDQTHNETAQSHVFMGVHEDA